MQGRAHLELFLISCLILFFEPAAIRWFAGTVVFLTFFTDIVLLAAFPRGRRGQSWCACAA